MKLDRSLVLREVCGISLDIVASISWAIAISIFAVPNQIVPGGVNGLTVIINYLTGLPVGTMSFILNIPLFILSWRSLGKRFVYQTMRALFIYSIVVDICFFNPPIYTGDPLLAAIFGGVFNGIGGGITFMQGSSGGGTDILNKLVRKRYPHIPTGQLSVGINGVILILAAFVYQNIEVALYGLIMSFASGKVIDAMLNGVDSGKSLMIMTSQPERISQMIIEQMHRSATILHGTGAYQGRDVSVLLCVVRNTEFYRLKRLIRETDDRAFVIVNEANMVIGKGFRSMQAPDT